MFITRIVFATLIVTGVAAEAWAADKWRKCENPPPPRVRVAMLAAPDVQPIDFGIIAEIVERTWRSEGLRFEWVQRPASRDLPSFDIVVLFQEPALQNVPAGALAAVKFIGGQPQRLARVSIDAAARWFERRMTEEGLWPRFNGPFSTMLPGALLNRVLGYVVAHEIGHILLASKEHSADGIMRATYTDVRAISNPAEPIAVDQKSKARLRLRMAGAALCAN